MRRIIAAVAATACAVLGMPAAASAGHIFKFEGTLGSALTADGLFVQPAGIATDAAGRVYVVDRGAARVEVYDSARDGHRFLRTIGAGRLSDPIDIDIDERDRAYVTDAGAHRVDVYDQFIRGSELMVSVGGPGSEPGQLLNPRYVSVSRAGHIHVVDRGNYRVSVFGQAPRDAPFMRSFNVTDPSAFSAPEGIAVDFDGVAFLSTAAAGEGRIRHWLHNGAYGGQFGEPGGGPGQIGSGAGMTIDGADRVVMADPTNHRVGVWSSDFNYVDHYGGLGSGKDQFSSPVDVDLAPGALMYVSDRDNRRIVRVRYDDTDGDGVAGWRDNCPSVVNKRQRASSLDARGDACGGDSNLLASSKDRCPRSKPRVDRNRDGCSDPRSILSRPRHNRTYTAARAARPVGRAFGDTLGIKRVEVAVRRVRLSGSKGSGAKRGKCLWYSPRARNFANSSCKRPRFFRARGSKRWKATIRKSALKPGLYTIISRARQRGGERESKKRVKKNVARFRVR